VKTVSVGMVKRKTNQTVKSYANTSVDIRLSSHEKICAERMKRLVSSIDELNKKVSKLSEDISKGKGIVSVLVFLGTLAAAVLGYLNLK
jgi:hypothetical protein